MITHVLYIWDILLSICQIVIFVQVESTVPLQSDPTSTWNLLKST